MLTFSPRGSLLLNCCKNVSIIKISIFRRTTIKLLIILYIFFASAALIFAQNHTVQEDETLYSISVRYGISVEELQNFNNITGTSIYPGDILQIPSDDEYVIQRGDSLSEIAYFFSTTVEAIRRINNLDGDRILVGNTLRIPSASNDAIYTVEDGDSLWSIAQRFDLDPDTLKSINNLTSDTIRPGMELKIGSGPSFETAQMASAELNISQSDNKGPYFNWEPDANRQLSASYFEQQLDNSHRNYQLAKEIKDNFDREISRAGRLSRSLRGWTVVIDPGHGGLDPGAVVRSSDGNNNDAIVVEDEYAYDIAVRVYQLLTRHGANTELTIISPNHQIRSTPDASLTFVNEKNEVYNSAYLNRNGTWDEWPVGTRTGLEKRLTVTQEAISGERRDRTIFISIHADNTPNKVPQNAILYGSGNSRDRESSLELARAIMPSMGSQCIIREENNLVVLENNPAGYAVLIEVRNLYYDNNSWLIRNEESRQNDAEAIVQGILNFVK